MNPDRTSPAGTAKVIRVLAVQKPRWPRVLWGVASLTLAGVVVGGVMVMVTADLVTTAVLKAVHGVVL